MNIVRKIYSKEDPSKLLHICYSTYHDAFNNNVTSVGKDVIRQDLVPDDQFLQAAHITIKTEGHKFRPHRHIPHHPEYGRMVIAQESWVVLSGKIKVYFYDIDDDNTLLEEVILNPGDISITLQGGHTYEALVADTSVIEFKTGPYKGQLLDKRFI